MIGMILIKMILSIALLWPSSFCLLTTDFAEKQLGNEQQKRYIVLSSLVSWGLISALGVALIWLG
jgi:hypothetical protein